MAQDHGAGTTRTLSAKDRGFTHVIWQDGKPPLDSELNLMASVDLERMRLSLSSQMLSGFFSDTTRSREDFVFDRSWSNQFGFGPSRKSFQNFDTEETSPAVFAHVGGHLVQVAGTDSEGIMNVLKLYPPPESDSRIDFVFLEVWTAILQPNPSTDNKPSSTTIWKYGNVKHGGSNVTDDLEYAAFGAETTKRIQVQYRLRVHGSGFGLGSGVNLETHPDGLGDPNINAQGAQSSPVSGYGFTNQRSNGDAGLWRSGEGDSASRQALGTVDGYVYAIPVCAVFRRASGAYVAVSDSGNPNQNAGFLRTPSTTTLSDALEGARELTTLTLSEDLLASSGVNTPIEVSVSGLTGSGLDDTGHVISNTFLRLGGEIVGLSAVDTVAGTITISSRGRFGTAGIGHASGSTFEFYNTRPDGKYADEITFEDVLDLRRSITTGEWDYGRILDASLSDLISGDLQTSWKKSAVGDTLGTVVHEVCELYAGNTSSPNHTDPVDGPDGIRTVWSDAATIQPDVTLLLSHDAARDSNGTVGFTNGALDESVEWDVGADFKPAAFMNTGGGSDGFFNGSSIHLWIGGSTGDSGARGTFRASGVEDVRFVTPQEYWKTGYPVVNPENGNQHPFTLRFLGEKQHEASPSGLETTPGPLYPWRETRFERPILVLGGLLNSSLHYEGINVSSLSKVEVQGQERFYLDLSSTGVDFDADGVFHAQIDGVFQNDPSEVSTPLLRGAKTLFSLLTSEGSDQTGSSSEVYLLTYGDASARSNNGGFRVIGAGTVGYTEHNAPNASSLVLEPLSADFTDWEATGSGNTLTVDLRSQWHNADDISDYDARIADCVVVLTDIGGEGASGTPWDLTNVGDLALSQDGVGGPYYAPSKAVLSTTLLYHPGRSATTRVADEITQVFLRGGSQSMIGSYLKRSPSALDTDFPSASATAETPWNPVHIQTWNRLPSLGWHAPYAPSYGGRVVGFTEQDRESEVFTDRGSKTLVFRPFRNRDMTLQANTWTFEAGQCLLGTYTYDNVSGTPLKDPLGILTGDGGAGQGSSGKRMGYSIPRESMPRFGRQDIPYYRLNEGSTPSLQGFLPGINHLFTDVTDLTSPVFNLIGGEPNAGGTEVNPLFFVTDSSEVGYGRSNSSYGPQGVGVMGARKTTDIDPSSGQDARDVIKSLKAVNSSDLGRGLQGIQFPPFIGTARVFGVYEYQDYINKGGRAHVNNRYELEADSATNLLREDCTAQALFILQDGAKDFTGETGDHTYILPTNAMDLTRIPVASGVHGGFVQGSSNFRDFQYVVEATVFHFAKGWINENTIVLARKRAGDSSVNSDGDDNEIENVQMCIPSPAGLNDKVYISSNRTVYQGDPFKTRDGNTRQSSDYIPRYGRLTPTQSDLLNTSIEQFDENGDFVPELSNPRVFQVVASRDFATTLGTGKIGGSLYAGTPLDVGFVENSAQGATRKASSSDSLPFRVDIRAFSEGQKTNTSRARATLDLTNNAGLIAANEYGDTYFVRLSLLDNTSVTLYGATAEYSAVLQAAPFNVDPQDIFEVDTVRETRSLVYVAESLDFGTLDVNADTANGSVLLTLDASLHAEVSEIPLNTPVAVSVSPQEASFAPNWGPVLFDASWQASANKILVRAIHPAVGQLFADESSDDLANEGKIRTFTWDPVDLAPDAVASQTFAWVGADPAKEQTLVVNTPLSFTGELRGFVSDVNEITLQVINTSNSNPLVIASSDFSVLLLEDVDVDAGEVDLSDVTLTFALSWDEGSVTTTTQNLTDALNANTKLTRTVRAFKEGLSRVALDAIPVGGEGNGIRVSVGKVSWEDLAGTTEIPSIQKIFRLDTPINNLSVRKNVTSTHLIGGVDIPVNAGKGFHQISLSGATERLPLGVLVQDSDFLCENPLNDEASAFISKGASLQPVQNKVPLTGNGEEFSRFTGSPGEMIAFGDVQVAPTSFAAYTQEAPDGATRKFRIYRGGGAGFLLSGKNPGGPLDWVSATMPSSLQPVLKGGMLACRALLVRSFYEEGLQTDGPVTTHHGDELQLVILTYAHFGDGETQTKGVNLDGILSPSGYGEGYAAADRYLCTGRPLVRTPSRNHRDPSEVPLAVFAGEEGQ